MSPIRWPRFAITTILTLLAGCSSDGPAGPSTPGSTDGGAPAEVQLEQPEGHCKVDEDCTPPPSDPHGCASGICDPTTSVCRFVAVDADGDGFATECDSLVPSVAVASGDDCDDDDETTYPGAPDICDGKIHTCGDSACSCSDRESKSCYSGPKGTAGVGICTEGITTCENGEFGECEGEVLPAKTEVCDGQDYFCGTKASQCPCSAGAVRECWDGDSSSRDVGVCKHGSQICDADGTWGDCVGQKLPFTGAPDATHPCDGTNWWCDADGVVPKHCAACTTQFTPQSCGSDSTCNKTATRTCGIDGAWGSCLPAPKTTCEPGQNYSCTTCSSVSAFQAGSHTCSGSCDFSGSICGLSSGQWGAKSTDAVFAHGCGFSCTPPTCPDSRWVGTPLGAGPSCVVQYGPYLTLPRGQYRVTFQVGTSGDKEWAIMDVFNGSIVPLSGGDYFPCLSPSTFCSPGQMAITNTLSNADTIHEYTFTVPSDCEAQYEFRVFYYDGATGTAGYVYAYETKVTYLGPP